MKIWSIQSIEVCDKIYSEGCYHCDINKSNLVDIDDFKRSYDWMANKMSIEIQNPHKSIDYPIWGWYKYDGKNKQPDLRRSAHGKRGIIYGCIELEIPDEEVLLSGFDEWHFVLLDSYLYTSENEDDIDREDIWFNNLSEKEQNKEKQKSWDRIFDISEANQYVQATFWEIKKENVCGIKYFKCK